MANLTLTIDDDLLRRARVRAAQEGTSVNAVVRNYLEHFASTSLPGEAVTAFLEIADGARAGTPGRPRTWKRADVYEDRVGPAPGGG